MPIFVNYFSLVVPKDILEKKYPGGVTQFKNDFSFTECDAMTEDDELIALYAMGYPYKDVEKLVSKGLHYNQEALFSTDFVVVDRLKPESCHWKPGWFETNSIFYWHTDCASWQKDKAREISKMTMDKVEEARLSRWNPFDTIRTKD